MPISKEEKEKTRAKIVESARALFNVHGFDGVSIDQIMATVGLTRGGFYNHFNSKNELYSETVSSFLMGRGLVWREEAGMDTQNVDPKMVRQMLESYLSNKHLDDTEGQCPMIALPSDIARAAPEVKKSYQTLLEAMVGLYSKGLDGEPKPVRQMALSLAALSVGGMVLARTLPDSTLAVEIRQAALHCVNDILGCQKQQEMNVDQQANYI